MDKNAVKNIFSNEDKNIRKKQMTLLFSQFINRQIRNCNNRQ